MHATTRPALMAAHQLWRPASLTTTHAHYALLPPRCFSLPTSPTKKRVVFLGTPKVAADVLDKLLAAAQAESSIFQVAAVVSQPPTTKGRGQKLLPSPVAQLAMERSFPENFIFWPQKAGEEDFLARLKEVQPDLCITAAYGNILPKRFLEIPTYGTVNIHPSLLPLYRGAAPVQRAIQDGVCVTGVTLAFTVRAMDAGPIIASESKEVDDCIKAPELLQLLFEKGTKLLLQELPAILDGSAAKRAQDQEHLRATHAPKVNVDESWIDFEEPAVVLHNKVRAFAEWPGTRARFKVLSPTGEGHDLELKLITTKPLSGIARKETDKHVIKHGNSSLIVYCGGDSALEILELQPAGKRVMSAKDFLNGLRGQQLKVI